MRMLWSLLFLAISTLAQAQDARLAWAPIATAKSAAPTATPTFNAGVQTRGIMDWGSLYGMVQACTGTPSSCYGGAVSVLNTTLLNKLCSDNIGHLRIGFNPGPLLVDPGNATQYYSDIFAALDQVGTSCLKIVLNIAPSFDAGSFPGWTYITIQENGHLDTKFTTYLSMLTGLMNEIASRQANPIYQPARFAIDLYNETPAAVSVTGGIGEQYTMMKLGWQTARAILPNHTLIVCLTGACDTYAQTAYASWSAADFDANTFYDFHTYEPNTAGFAGFPGLTWRDVGPVPWPPTTGAYAAWLNTVYEPNLSADTSWAGDCTSTGTVTASATTGTMTVTGGSGTVRKWQTLTGTGISAVTYVQSGTGPYTIVGPSGSAPSFASTTVTLTGGPNCNTAKQSNHDTILGQFSPQYALCYFGQSPGVFPCPSGAPEDSTWQATFYGQITTWRTAFSIPAKQVYVGEFGFPGVWSASTGLTAADQATALGSVVTILNGLGFSWTVLERSYSTSTAYGFYQTFNPYATVNSAAVTAMQWNGQ